MPAARGYWVVVAETGLQWQDDGEPALLQVSIMFRVPALLLVLLLSLYSWALRAQTTEASVTGHNGSIVFYAVRLRTWKK
jgi:hypothetical protein